MEEKIKELIEELNEAFGYIGGRLKDLNEKSGNLTELQTTAKATLVAALNELQQTVSSIQASGGGVSELTVQQKIDAAFAAFKQELYGGELVEELNQLKEFADAITQNKSVGSTLLAKLAEVTQELTAVKNALKTDFTAIVKKAESGV